MIERIAVDTNAVVQLIRADLPDPPMIHAARTVFLPLPVIGELLAGVYGSRFIEKNRIALDLAIETWHVLQPDLETAHVYARVRSAVGRQDIGNTKRIDLWIAALCIQHDLPLLTNDRGFATLKNLRVLRW